MAVFGRQVLASHCVTGRRSNAFKEKEAKPQLDPAKITDILGKQNILRNELYTVISLSNVFVKNIKTVYVLLLCYFLQNS